MRTIGIALSFVIVAGAGCGGKGGGDWPVAEDTGKFSNKADVDKFFDDALASGDTKYKEIFNVSDRRPKELTGTFVIETIKTGTKFKGDTAGLWVKGPMPGSVDASECEATLRFSGPVTGPISMATGWVWFEQLPTGAFQLTLSKKEQPTVIVFSKATRADVQKLQLKMRGAPMEVVLLEGDMEPGRYKTPPEWGATEPPPGIGIGRLTVCSKIEATTP